MRYTASHGLNISIVRDFDTRMRRCETPKCDTHDAGMIVRALASNNMSAPITISVNTTILSTTFITITSHISAIPSVSCAGNIACREDSQSASNGTISNATTSQVSLSPGRPPHILTSSGRSFTRATSTRADSHTARHPSTTISSSSNAIRKESTDNVQKHAIIGGLSGAIAGLVLIGIILCACFKRRQKHRNESDRGRHSSMGDTLRRSWSQLTNTVGASRTASEASQQPIAVPIRPPMSSQSSSTGLNGSFLQVSMSGWSRPFAHHQSFRESVGPGALRVANPDTSLGSVTPVPRGSTESGGTYLKRQRSAITGALFGTRLSRSSSLAPSSQQRPQRAHSASTNAMASSDSLAQPSQPSSSASQYSISSAAQRVDPFLTPPLEESTVYSPSRPQRPTLAVLHNAGRSLSNLGQTLNPFRSRVDATTEDEDLASRHSTLTFSSDGDPFRLDRSSMSETSTRSRQPG